MIPCYFLSVGCTCLICRRPTSIHDRGRDSDDDDFQGRDYDVAALANNLSQAFRYGIYSNDDIEEVIF
jgi:serine/threonine-protein phosphatase 6 regulatory subunit 3